MDMGSTPSQLVEEHKKPSYITQYIAAFSACMGAFCFGTALGYSSPAGPMLMNATSNAIGGDLILDKTQNSLFVSTVNIGALVGGPIGGLLISNLGRKGTMLLSVVGFLGAWILTIFGQNFAMLISSRVIMGLSTGITCIAVPTYIGELASVDIRGTLGSGFQLMAVTGIEFAYVFGAVVDSWQVLAAICAIPPVIFFGLIFISKESPIYLLSKGKEKEAKISLQYFRGKNYDIQKELDAMKESLEESKRSNTSMKDLFSSYLLKPLTISLALMFFQQFSGINAVLLNLTIIFKDAGTDISDDLCVIIVGLVLIMASAASTILIDKAGRKLLLIISSSVMAISLVALGVFFYEKDQGNAGSLGWLPLLSLILFITSFSIGYGSIPWLMMNELFPRSAAEVAGSLSTMMNWSMSFICTLTFEPLKLAIHSYGVYWLFAFICVVNLVFCITVVPETKGKTIEEITAIFGGPSASTDNDAKSTTKERMDVTNIA